MTTAVSGWLARQTDSESNLARYEECLGYFWQGDTQKALDLVTDYLLDGDDETHRYKMYRLWVEVLSQDEDRASLVHLGEHLFLRGQAEPDCHATFAAMRGLVHLELDEFDGARLIAENVVDFVDDPYCMELCSRIALRQGEPDCARPLLEGTSVVDDYFCDPNLSANPNLCRRVARCK